MAFKVKVVPIGPSNTTIFQMAAGSEGAIHGLVFCNNNAESRTLTVKLLDGSESTTSVIMVKVMEPNSQYTWPKPINMESGDALIATGADLIALHSTYVGTATPATQGFTGRGTWSNVASYNPNDVVNYEGSSYLANAANTGSTPPSADWTLLSAKGTAGIPSGEIRTPTAVSPLTGGLTLAPNGVLEASAYAPLYSSDTRNYREFQIATDADTTFASPVFSAQVNANTVNITPTLSVSTAYRWRCRDVSTTGAESDWMTVQTFTTKNLSVVTPTVSVSGFPSTVNRAPLISTAAYATTPENTATHLSTSWEIRKVSDNSLVWSSYNDTANLLSIQVPFNVLTVATQYYFRAKHNSTIYGESPYGSVTATTLPSFVNETFSPTVISNERRYVMATDKAVGKISDNSYIVANVERDVASGATLSTDITLSIWNRVGGVFVENTASTVVAVASADFSKNDGDYTIEMLTSTLGFIVFRDRTATTMNLAVRAFSITGGTTISMGSRYNIDTAATASGFVNISAKRLSDTLAVVLFYESTQATSIGLVFSNLAITAGTPVAFTSSVTTALDYRPKIHIDRITDITFIATLTYIGATPDFRTTVKAAVVNATNGAVVVGTEITVGVASTSTSASMLRIPKVAVLTPTLAIVGTRTADTTTCYVPITISTTTLTAGTVVNGSTTAFNNNRSDLVRVSDTSALMLDGVGNARVLSIAAGVITEGTAVAIQPEVPIVSHLIRIANDGDLVQFEQWAQTEQALFNYEISTFGGGIFSTSAAMLKTKPLFTQYTTLNKNDSITMLSPTRAVVMERDGGFVAGQSTAGRVELSMWNMEQNTPTRIVSTFTNFVAASNIRQSAVQAISTSLVLAVAFNTVKLFSASDAGFTELYSATLTGVNSNVSSATSIVRISNTEAIICFNNTGGGVSAQYANLAGNTITLSGVIAVSARTGVNAISAIALSPTRVLVTSYSTAATAGMYVSLLGPLGGVWGGVVLDQYVGTVAPITTAPHSLSVLDSTRVLVGVMNGATTGIAIVINTTGDVIAAGSGGASTPNIVSNTTGMSYYTQAIDNVNCLAVVQETTGTKLYSFTVGSGTATPSALTFISNLNTNTVLANPAIRMVPLGAITTGPLSTAMVAIQERDGGLDQTQNVLLRKFLRGTV